MVWTIYEDTSSNQIRGQLSFIEEQKRQKEIEVQKSYASPCGGCVCNQCANDVNGRYKPGEMVEPCFNCEKCRNYDGNSMKKYNYKTECSSFKITEHHASQNRRKIKLIR